MPIVRFLGMNATKYILIKNDAIQAYLVLLLNNIIFIIDATLFCCDSVVPTYIIFFFKNNVITAFETLARLHHQIQQSQR